MKEQLIKEIELHLQREDFGKNWDGAYQDALPTIRQYLTANGFETRLFDEWETQSRESELVAQKDAVTLRLPWQEDYNGKSIVDLTQLAVDRELSSQKSA